MPTEAEATATIRTALRDGVSWPSPAPGVFFENTSHPAAAEFVSVFVESFDSQVRSMGPVGARSFLRRGRVLAACHQAVGTGDARVLAFSQAIKAALEGVEISGVIFRQHTAPVDKGVTPSGAWYFFVVSVDYEYHEQR